MDSTAARAKPLTVAIRTLRSSRWAQWGVVGGLLLAAAIFPLTYSGYWIRLLSGMFMYAALASSLNIMVGYTGYADFGNVVFFGVGAYTTAILMLKVGAPLPLAVLAGGALAALYAMLLGLPILRLRGHYFAIATIGVQEATRELVVNATSLTGGGAGLTLPIPDLTPQQFYRLIYYLMLGAMVLVVTVSGLIRRSRFGYGLRAIKADADAAEISGINTTWYKVAAWMTSAALSGIVGGIWAYWYSYIQPPDAFSGITGVKYFIMTLLGGAGTLVGPVVGAFVLELISETVWSRFITLHLGVLGTIIVLVVLFMPRGLVPMLREGFKPKAWWKEFQENWI
jgi:branched-chain amino acid transport system permease protein